MRLLEPAAIVRVLAPSQADNQSSSLRVIRCGCPDAPVGAWEAIVRTTLLGTGAITDSGRMRSPVVAVIRHIHSLRVK